MLKHHKSNCVTVVSVLNCKGKESEEHEMLLCHTQAVPSKIMLAKLPSFYTSMQYPNE